MPLCWRKKAALSRASQVSAAEGLRASGKKWKLPRLGRQRAGVGKRTPIRKRGRPPGAPVLSVEIPRRVQKRPNGWSSAAGRCDDGPPTRQWYACGEQSAAEGGAASGSPPAARRRPGSWSDWLGGVLRAPTKPSGTDGQTPLGIMERIFIGGRHGRERIQSDRACWNQHRFMGEGGGRGC